MYYYIYDIFEKDILVFLLAQNLQKNTSVKTSFILRYRLRLKYRLLNHFTNFEFWDHRLIQNVNV